MGWDFIVYEYEVEIFSAKFKLAPYCTVYQAEHFAIYEAVKWNINNKTNAQLYSDSQAALKSIINNKHCLHTLTVHIRELIKQTSYHICMGWVKGLKGVIGNKRADMLAKKAAFTVCHVFL